MYVPNSPTASFMVRVVDTAAFCATVAATTLLLLLFSLANFRADGDGGCWLTAAAEAVEDPPRLANTLISVIGVVAPPIGVYEDVW